jgi:hypothetical protein
MATMIALLALLAQDPSPTHATIEVKPPKGGSACEYTSDDPAKKGLVFCTNVATEDACKAAAARKVPAAWLEAHPAKFSAGVDCKASDKRLAKQAKKDAAKAKKANP